MITAIACQQGGKYTLSFVGPQIAKIFLQSTLKKYRTRIFKLWIYLDSAIPLLGIKMKENTTNVHKDIARHYGYEPIQTMKIWKQLNIYLLS